METNKSKIPNKRKLISILAALFIVGGIILVAFPYLQGMYYEVIKAPNAIEETAVNDNASKEADTALDEVESEPAESAQPSNSSYQQSGTTASTYGGQGTLPVGSTGVLEIPKLGLKLNVLYGITDGVLKQGIGFYPQSDDPSTGNVCIAGHRNAYGSPFWHLDKLMPGDSIILYYNNNSYHYKVALNYITDNKDWSIINPTEKPAITLTTCDPKIRPANGIYNRLVIRGYTN